MTLEHNEQVVKQAIDRLPGLFGDLPNWQRLVTALTAEVQRLEDVQYDMLVDGLLDNARGDALDQYGDLVNEAREGIGDSVYRGIIRARIRANRSNGAASELLAVALLLGAVNTKIFEHFPATVSVEMVVPDSFDITGSEAGRRGGIVELAKGAGIFIRVVEAQIGYFAFADNPDGLGFDDGLFATRTD